MTSHNLAASDSPGVYKVVTPQSHNIATPLPAGVVYRINTGAPLPAGVDSVIMVEDTELVSTFDESCEEKEVRTLSQVPSGENVRAPGSDVRKGDLALSVGEILHGTGGEIGTLAFVGRKSVSVAPSAQRRCKAQPIVARFLSFASQSSRFSAQETSFKTYKAQHLP